MDGDTSNTTLLLQRLTGGDREAYDALFGIIYEDLRRRARHFLRDGSATLSTTALVHETYLSLAAAELTVSDRAHFFRLAARAMRNILIDAERRRNAAKRGDGQAAITLGTDLPAADSGLDLLALNEALDGLGRAEPRLARVVELHFFAGLEFIDIAELLELSVRTVGRDWRSARALLQMHMDDAAGVAGST